MSRDGGPQAAPKATPAGPPAEELRQLLQRAREQPPAAVVQLTHGSQTTLYQNLSLLSPALGAPKAPEGAVSEQGREVGRYAWDLLERATEADSGCDAAVGALVGLAIGDSVGHPLEFIAVDQSLPENDTYSSISRPCLRPALDDSHYRLVYQSAFNKFDLKGGQWTDDTSTALALADSLLVHDGYHGGDARARWHMWWFHGYCNAFRFDASSPQWSCDGGKRSSVGLGGNVAASLQELERDCGSKVDNIPECYRSQNEDAGNGSMARLAPVAVAFHERVGEAEQVAELQSRATHPGPDASACCRFMAFFVSEALRRHKDGAPPSADPRQFVADCVAGFLERHPPEAHPGDTGHGKLAQLLQCEYPSEKECNWNWKAPELRIRDAIRYRQGCYGGYPVVPTSWGSYSMDGLAVALWALHRSTTFDGCLLSVVNLLGDADTTGAIACQMAGAMYGFRALAAGTLGQQCVINLRQWDPYAEVGLRGALLYTCPPKRAFAHPSHAQQQQGQALHTPRR